MVHTWDLDWLTDELLEVQRRHAARVEALYRGELTEPFVAVSGRFFGASHGLWGTNDIDMLAEPQAWLETVLTDMAGSVEALCDDRTFRPAAIEVDPLGTHFIDALFGARTEFRAGQVWAETLSVPMAELAVPDLEACAVFLHTKRLLELAVEASAGRLWIGMPVLSCPVNIAINLFGTEFLMALAAEPDLARRALTVITEVIVTATRKLGALVPPAIRRTSVAASRFMPAGHGLVDGCATQLVSPGHYREMLLPCDEAVLACYAHGGMLHLCGASAQHAPAFGASPGIRTIQLADRALEDLPVYLEHARPEQVFYLRPCEAMPVETCIESMAGRPFVLQAKCPDA